MKFPKLIFRKSIPVIGTDKQGIGRVPIHVARELIKTNHAEILHNHPSVIGLRHIGNRIASPNRVISTSPLKNLVTTASLFVAKNSRIPALNSIMLQITNNRLYVSATNLDAFFKGCLESDNRHAFSHDKDVSGICINAVQIKKILLCTDETTTTHIKGGDTPSLQIGTFFVEGFSPKEFPWVQFKEGNKTMSFTVTNIAEKLNFVGNAISANKYRSSLCGIYFDIARRQLAGADGNRLHTVPMNESGKTQSDKHAVEGVIVPASVLKVARLLTGVGRIIAGSDAGQGTYQYVNFALSVPGCGDCTATFRTVDGQFPKYEDVIPKEYASRFTTRTQDLLPVLNKALIANTTDSDSKPILAEFKNGQMIITVNVRGRVTYRGVVQGQYSGVPYRSVVNDIFLLDAIQTIPGDSIEIMLQSKNDEAWKIRNSSGYTAIIMPIELES